MQVLLAIWLIPSSFLFPLSISASYLTRAIKSHFPKLLLKKGIFVYIRPILILGTSKRVYIRILSHNNGMIDCMQIV